MKDCESCSTTVLTALDRQSIAEILDLSPGALLAALGNAPLEGFPIALTPRILRLTSPLQRGKDVFALQQKLGLKADGVFGVVTDAAVRRWQVAQWLQGDGAIGGVSREKIAYIN